jgi:hypothetical protein
MVYFFFVIGRLLFPLPGGRSGEAKENPRRLIRAGGGEFFIYRSPYGSNPQTTTTTFTTTRATRLNLVFLICFIRIAFSGIECYILNIRRFFPEFLCKEYTANTASCQQAASVYSQILFSTTEARVREPFVYGCRTGLCTQRLYIQPKRLEAPYIRYKPRQITKIPNAKRRCGPPIRLAR